MVNPCKSQSTGGKLGSDISSPVSWTFQVQTVAELFGTSGLLSVPVKTRLTSGFGGSMQLWRRGEWRLPGLHFDVGLSLGGPM